MTDNHEWYMEGETLRCSLKPLAHFQNECKYRGLPSNGAINELALRIFQNMEQRKSWKGQQQDYSARLKIFQTANKSKEIVPFSRFPDFPLEIQRHIWFLSLPGPRFLIPQYPRFTDNVADGATNYNHHDPDRFLESGFAYRAPGMEGYQSPWLKFEEEYRVPNPIALSVCQISREVALSKYQLCFGTSHIYADLSTDILFFPGHAWTVLRFLQDWLVGWHEGSFIDAQPPLIIADLLRVQNLGFDYEGLYDEFDPVLTDQWGEYGNMISGYLEGYKSLKTVVLCDPVSFHFQQEPSEPGQILFDDIKRITPICWQGMDSYQVAMRIIGCFEEDGSVEEPRPKLGFCPIKMVYNVPTLEEFIERPYA